MKKETLRERVARYPTLDTYITEREERDPEFKVELDRARLRVAIARAIKHARELAGMTQAELASALQLKQSAIGRLESLRDQRLPSVELLLRIAAVTRKRLVVKQGGVRIELIAKSA
jgi:DNA-binding XRE family transcriptional regulator